MIPQNEEVLATAFGIRGERALGVDFTGGTQVEIETLKKEKLALKDELYQILRKAAA